MHQTPFLSRVSLPTQIYQLLKRRIVTNDLALGLKLTEQQLAKELGVSRTPIREALNRLIQDGLVTASPGRGAFVATFQPYDIVEFFEVREALEGMAARLAASRITREALTRLRRQLEAGVAHGERDGYTGYLEADRKFHEAVTSASGNRHLCQLMGALRERIQILRHRSVVLPGRARKSFQEHLNIIEALSRHDQAVAEERMRAHIRNVKEDLIATINGYHRHREMKRRAVHSSTSHGFEKKDRVNDGP